MSNYNHLDKMIRESLNENLDRMEVDSRVKEETIFQVKNRMKNSKLSNKAKRYFRWFISLLDREIEIPVSYLAISICVVLIFCSYQISGIIPDASEINTYNFNWIINNYKGMS
ncbi:MAG: hypothetical protein ACLFUI_03160 [Halanaerobiales bacterium]